MLDKIKKLFALANDKGASEDEAATAMRLAMGLMAKHGITQDQLGEKPKARRGSKINAVFQKYQLVLGGAAAHLYGCRFIFYNKGKDGVSFAGREENIEAATLTLMFLTRQVEELYKQHLRKGMTQQQRSEYRKTFKWACSARVEERAVVMMEELKNSNQSAKAVTGQNALVVADHFKRLTVEADEVLAGSVKEVVLQAPIGSGTEEGHRAGDQVKLRQELNA